MFPCLKPEPCLQRLQDGSSRSWLEAAIGCTEELRVQQGQELPVLLRALAVRCHEVSKIELLCEHPSRAG